MLAQILHDLNVPRELLDGLSEDHKQLLFCKMREEQVRRYHEREEEEDEQQKKMVKIHSKTKKKRVKFLLGADGKEWCWVMGESETPSKTFKNNNENIQIVRQNHSRMTVDGNLTSPAKSEAFYTPHRDERKQIEEISNNIQEARRVFERLESDTRQLVLSKESEVLQQQKSRPSPSQNEIIDEQFYREIEERAKKADRDRRDAARRARDSFQRNSLQLNVCFDTENHTTLLFQPPPLNSTKTAATNEKEIRIELLDKKLQQMPTTVDDYRSKPLLPLTRDDIRRWFCTYEIPYGTFRSPNGQIYPWFHGIISRSYTEQILSSKPIGTYLIRINEKIFGYALSYRATDHCRHLLIEVVCSTSQDNKRGDPNQPHAYRFLGGAKYESFTQLVQLIEKYSNTPIRSNSSDVLRFPCGQIDAQKADYADLFVENDKQYEPLYISLETTTSSAQTTTHL